MKKLTLVLGLILIPISLIAHELPLDSLNINTQNIQTVASFSLNEQQINKVYHDSASYFDHQAWFDDYLAKVNLTECVSTSQTKACGIIDPFTKAPKDEPFYVAGLVGIYLCNAYGSLNLGNYNKGLVPMFTAPTNFISTNTSSTDHHSNYTLSEGISFDCVFELATTPVVKQKS